MAAVMALLQRLELDLKEERLSEAEAVLGRLRAAATSVDEEWATAYADRGAGLYAIARKDWAAAVAPLEEAARRWERIGWPFERAVCLYDLGVALQGAGERAKSAEVFDRALETFTRLGARRHVEKTLARKQLLAA
jgi:tetratricopeptide (TPR) repeat protein